MSTLGKTVGGASSFLLMLSISAAPVLAAGFGIFEQGTKAMGMAGAFTAQADDPSAIFHNPAGLAFQQERDFLLGVTYITATTLDFFGAEPFPGVEVREQQETLGEFLPHFYWVEPLSERWTFGLGLNAPFGLVTEWKNKDAFSGRFISEKAAMRLLNLSPNLAWKASDDFSVGLGLMVYYSDVELNNRRAAVDPFTGQPAEIAKATLEGGFDEGFGWQLGILHRYNNSFSWGLMYRSRVEIDYGGKLELTQVPTGNTLFDTLVAGLLPFGRTIDGDTSIEFPDLASLGLAFSISRQTLVEIDVNWTGWSSFDRLFVEFGDPLLPPLDRPEDWDDVFHYRLGVKWQKSPRSEWRFGYVYDESPQPSKAVGPLLADATRNGFTVGYGRRGGRVGWDLALMYLPFDERTITDSEDGYFGTYDQSGFLFGLSLGF